jgi:hypothetical protein
VRFGWLGWSCNGMEMGTEGWYVSEFRKSERWKFASSGFGRGGFGGGGGGA